MDLIFKKFHKCLFSDKNAKQITNTSFFYFFYHIYYFMLFF